jgi:hypothetical protein
MKIGSRYPDLLTLLWRIWASFCLSTHLRKISPENALERMQAILFIFGSVTGEISSFRKRCTLVLIVWHCKVIHSLCLPRVSSKLFNVCCIQSSFRQQSLSLIYPSQEPQQEPEVIIKTSLWHFLIDGFSSYSFFFKYQSSVNQNLY